MAQKVTVVKTSSGQGCGCLALILLVSLVFLKTFWRPLLVVSSLLLAWGLWHVYIVNTQRKYEKRTQTDQQLWSDPILNHPPIKDAEVIGEDEG